MVGRILWIRGHHGYWHRLGRQFGPYAHTKCGRTIEIRHIANTTKAEPLCLKCSDLLAEEVRHLSSDELSRALMESSLMVDLGVGI